MTKKKARWGLDSSGITDWSTQLDVHGAVSG